MPTTSNYSRHEIYTHYSEFGLLVNQNNIELGNVYQYPALIHNAQNCTLKPPTWVPEVLQNLLFGTFTTEIRGSD